MATNTGFGKFKWFDDFEGYAIDTTNDVSVGADSGGSFAANAQSCGAGRLTTHSNSGDTTAVCRSLTWKAANGGIIMEARLTNVTAITTRAIFVGLTDTIATSTTVEFPISLSGSTFTTTATDAVGFVYDTDATTDVWYCMGVKADTDATSVSTATAPSAAATWDTLRVMVDADGNADFFVNGVFKGHVANAVTASVALTPIVVLETRSDAAVYADVDYMYCEGGRV